MAQIDIRDPHTQRQQWIILILAAVGTFMSTLDVSILYVALPTLTSAFDTTVAVSQWFGLSYNFVITILLMPLGKLGDLKGRKKLYVLGIFVFVIGSLTCGLSKWAIMLILARAFQGAGSAMTMSAGPALVTEAFPAKERGKALGLIGTSVAMGLLIGPMAGGLIIQHTSWRWLFFINIPIGLGLIYLLETRVHGFNEKRPGQLDLAGAGLMTLAIASLLFALTFGSKLGWMSAYTLVLFAGAIVFIAAFIFVEQRVENPTVDLKLFKNREFTIGSFTGWTNFAAMVPVSFYMPFYLGNLLHFDPQHVGLILASGPLTLAVLAPISGALSDKIGSRFLTTAGLLVMTTGLYSMRSLGQESSSFDVVWKLMLVSAGSALFVSPNSSSVMGSVKKDMLGLASGTIALVRNFGMTCGIAIAGAIILTTQGNYHPTGELANQPQIQHFAFFLGLKEALLASAAISFIGAFMSSLRVRAGDEEKWEKMG